ncbi:MULTISPECIES: tetratricopeptide repeat protein [unclassified Streptococcus]|uniref:tetratricopeptide repeat protein n=1 Tax=unclassified Streptococcus TaxID=2608887 RepID=UPI001071A0F9|nr:MULTISPECIES: tetratricopeptide repeat protein [unclassified Streptococcus]MBF0786508.1 tetratricopeptide repeat protein [Streptococcus sp. 19428wC2_LYSM12]MCQ9212336.1 tetratricopeptide repeat protein [Streptococcus sp. B01]MCQ9213667.1 tetratricopeptide repeat protein [Streptococcus sp. O1]TFV06670.1 tetratricopeptide repeat protein [Streptococcus sp. LYSM12]
MNNSEKMLTCLEQQDLHRAIKYFQRALETDSDEVLLDLAVYLESIGFLPQAKEIYLRLQENYPELAIQLAQIANEDGLIDEAFGYLELITPDSPAYLEALLVKADLYQSEGLADVAREKLLEASHLTDEPVILFGLAELDMELQEYKEAIQYYAQLDNREIYEWTGISTYQRIGLAYASLGKFEVAIEFFEKSVELAYDDQTVFELATLLLDLEDYQKSALYFKQLDAMNPEFEGYEYAYAKALHGEHQLTEAREMIAKGLAKNEYDPALLLLASQYAYEDHDVKAAEEYLLQAKSNIDDENEVVLRLSNLYLEQERYEEAVRLYSEELDHVLAIWNIAKAYQALERDTEALALFEQLQQDLAENPEFLADYIELLRQLGRVQEARNLASHYLHLVPDDLLIQEFYNQG